MFRMDGWIAGLCIMLLCIGSISARSPVLTVPIFGEDETTKGIMLVDLEDGKISFCGYVKSTPDSIDIAPAQQNILDALGLPRKTHPSDGAVLIGGIRRGDGKVEHFLAVDTQRGKMAFIIDRGAGNIPIETEISPSILSNDGNYALLMQRASSGKTKGAYLYHATTGNCLFLGNINKVSKEVNPDVSNPLPKLSGKVSAVEMLKDNEATSHFLVLDNSSGEMFLVENVEKGPSSLSYLKCSLNIFDIFPRDKGKTLQKRFIMGSIPGGGGGCRGILIIDIGSGEIAILDNVHKPDQMQFRKSAVNIFSHLPRSSSSDRVCSLVLRITGKGTAKGAWLFDNISDKIFYIADVTKLDKLTVLPVRYNFSSHGS